METNIEMCRYIDVYKNLMDSLTVERQVNSINVKINKQLIECDFFTIEGDETFKENIKKCIEDLVKIKPGRKLFKELLKVNQAISKYYKDPIILIKQDTSCRHDQNTIYFTFDEENPRYNAIMGTENITAEKPIMVRFAHELIHELHDRHELERRCENFEKTKDIFTYSPVDYSSEIQPMPGMDTFEEQHTISGINIPLFIKKNKLDKCDVLCENAFLMALRLPPRIDHRAAKDYPFKKNNIRDYGFYYDWMEKALVKRKGCRMKF